MAVFLAWCRDSANLELRPPKFEFGSAPNAPTSKIFAYKTMIYDEAATSARSFIDSDRAAP